MLIRAWFKKIAERFGTLHETKISLPEMNTNKNDRLAAVARAAVGIVPIIGPSLSEIITEIIPNQRMDRIVQFAATLEARLRKAEFDLDQIKNDPERIALFEQGAFQASRATSNERREQIARIVAYGMAGDDLTRVESTRILQLLEQLEDDQIVILTSYLHRHERDAEFHERHAAILNPVRAHLNSSQDEFDRSTIQKLPTEALIRLGLLSENFRRPKKGELPEFDFNTGRVRSSYKSLTPLGRLLLVRLGLAEPGEF